MPWDDGDLAEEPTPLWYRIAQRLTTAIDRGEFVPGEVLPSETVLTQRFGVSRATARAALDHLKGLGLVDRRPGRGSIVRAKKVEQPLTVLTSFSEDMRARGLHPGHGPADVGRVQAVGDIASALEVPPGAEVVVVDRLMLADGSPIATSRSYLHPRVVAPDEDLEGLQSLRGSLYDWLAKRGAVIASGTEVIGADVARSATAKKLELPLRSSLVVARRIARDHAGRPLEYAYREYRADRYSYRVELQRP